MDSKLIYQTLLSRCPSNSANLAHLRRYVKFIFQCIRHNKSLPEDTVFEYHHILPKSKRFFPEYSSFKKHPWNRATLTPRQHFIAHVMLAKSLGDSMWFALHMMCINSSRFNSRDYRVPSKIYDEARKRLRDIPKCPDAIKKASLKKKGWGHFKDDDDVQYYLRVDDPSIALLGLVGRTKGISNKGVNKGTVSCKNIHTGELIKVSKEEFDKNPDLVGVNHGSADWSRGRRWMKCPEGNYFMVEESEVQSKLEMGYIFCTPSTGIPNEKLSNTVWLNDNTSNIRVPVSEVDAYLEKGYSKGRLKFKQSKVRDILTCPHCGKKGKRSGRMFSHHFDNCVQSTLLITKDPVDDSDQIV